MEHPQPKTLGRFMNALALVEEARTCARRLEKSEAERLGVSPTKARPHVARRLSVSPGTLENVSRGRLKDPLRLMGLYERLRAVLVAELSKEIARLTHERDLLLATGADPRSDAMAQAEAGIKQAKEALGGAVK